MASRSNAHPLVVVDCFPGVFIEEKNQGLGLRLLESARIKLRTAIDALPSCSYSHWSIGKPSIPLAHTHARTHTAVGLNLSPCR
jgi:hypothetical protein